MQTNIFRVNSVGVLAQAGRIAVLRGDVDPHHELLGNGDRRGRRLGRGASRCLRPLFRGIVEDHHRGDTDTTQGDPDDPEDREGLTEGHPSKGIGLVGDAVTVFVPVCGDLLAGLHARRLAGHLGVARRVGQVGKAAVLVGSHHVQQRFD